MSATISVHLCVTCRLQSLQATYEINIAAAFLYGIHILKIWSSISNSVAYCNSRREQIFSFSATFTCAFMQNVTNILNFPFSDFSPSCSPNLHFYAILFYPITLEGRRGTTDELAIIPFHPVLFSVALAELYQQFCPELGSDIQ